MTSVRIDPRIRERRVEVQREAGRRRLRVLLAVMTCICVAGVAYLAVKSPLLDVDKISISGEQHTGVDAIRAATGVRVHDPLVFVNSGAVATRVHRLPWVRSVSVRRDFPSTLRVAVTEYVPTAYVRASSGVVLVADDGRVIARAPKPAPHTVEVRGVRRLPDIGSTLAPTGVAAIVPQLPHALGARVAAIDVSGGGLALVLRAGGEIRLGNADDLAAKAAAAQAVLAHLGDAPFSYIDVSTPQRPVSHD